MSPSLVSFAPDIYIKYYPIHFAGCRFNSVMTVIRLNSGKLLLHSPCEIDDPLKAEIEQLGQVSYIVAPGNYHHLHVQSCKKAFPSAQVYLCPGLETKRPELAQGAQILDNKSPLDPDLEHVFLGGNRIICEVVFYHKPSKTLVLTDSIEYIGDKTPDTNWGLKMWWLLFCTWNKPVPAPEYRMGWMCKNKTEARECMEQILQWDFDKVIISHGDNITEDAKSVVRRAWKGVLGNQ